MSKLTIEPYVMPAAHLGGENPLAPLRAYDTVSAAGIGSSTGDYPDAGNEGSILPYRLQDQYDRARDPRAFKAAVLENEHLRATFLLELGGRLWSLVHKSSGRELLFRNPVFQPANLATRDAWFSGGVEWNISIIGHSPFTCSPLFAARVVADDGTPVLRMYEWDRVRRVPFQIDAWLPDGSPFMRVRVRITNPNDHAIPMYWWSNIAVDERKDVRVLAPAEQAQRHAYDGKLVAHDVPIYGGIDVSYTTNRRSASDLYFRIPKGHRPWIAALDGRGQGLVQTSTDRLYGRKMFNWGTDSGGKRWQSYLSEPGQGYIEIQGGLAHTQGEYVTMPARATWEWLEAYGLIGADPETVHGTNWPAAYQAVERELELAIPRASVDAELAATAGMADRAPAEILHHGSGWGALENRRRAAARVAPFSSAALPFPAESMTAEQAPWIALMEPGTLPSRPTSSEPGSLMVQPEWRDMLEQAVQRPEGSHWLSWYHLGVMRYRAGNRAGAMDAWERSLAIEPSPWARRDLAVLAREAGDEQSAADQWLEAARLAPDLVPLAIETARALLRADRHADAVGFVESLPPHVRSHGRLRLLHATASLETGDLAALERFFAGDLDIANVREKETNLSDLWFAWQAKRVAKEQGIPETPELRRRVRREFPPPPRFDFRLNITVDE